MQTRIILYHRHPVSGHTMFLRFGHGGVCGVEPLPEGAQLPEDGLPGTNGRVAIHPGFILHQSTHHLQLAEGMVVLDSGFYQQVESREGPLGIFLGHFTSHDAPFFEIDHSDAALIEMSDVRALRRVEQGLLRRFYDFTAG